MDERLEMSMLFDIYGELLTEKKKETMNLYYNEDYSLGEISEIQNISRQAIHDTIKKCNKQIREFEQRLSLLNKMNDDKNNKKELIRKIAEIEAINDNIDIEKKLKELAELIVGSKV